MQGSTTVDTTPNPLSRHVILDATSDCLHSSGYDATTIRRIAGKLSCSVGSIYRYFDDKRQLLFAVTQRSMQPVADMLEAGASFEDSVARYHELAGRDAEAYRLMFWLAGAIHHERDGQGDALANAQARGAESGAAAQRAQAPLPPIVDQIIQGWAQRLGDATLAQQCWALLHGSIMLGHGSAATLTMLARLAPQHTDHQPEATDGPAQADPPRETATWLEPDAQAARDAARDDLTLL